VRKLAVAALALAAFACNQDQITKKLRDDKCAKNTDCAFGLECVDAATQADGGVATVKTCQYHSFGDCEGDGTAPGPDGQPQCLHTYKCRDSHCTVQCAGHKDCKEGEVCNRFGTCVRGSNQKLACVDTRDCAYPQVCNFGQCVLNTVARCATDLDCGAGSRCINATCQ
jgi:hypothetical protein